MQSRLHLAILQTMHYADIFDYVLTPDELERYLIGVRAGGPEIRAALCDLIERNACAVSSEGLLTLPGREMLAAERLRLRSRAGPQKRRACLYARLLGQFPFVRMVALTGALAMENARDDDIDLLIVSAPGHLWTVRAAAVALVRLARLGGDHLCPNFLITENRLAITDENLYNAHEIVQMAPLYGFKVYKRFRNMNNWACRFLPNAQAQRQDESKDDHPIGILVKQLGERVLASALGRAIEQWEMSRKIKKLSASIPPGADDVEYSGEACRGFISGHGRRVLAEFDGRARELEAACAWSVEYVPVMAAQSVPAGS